MCLSSVRLHDTFRIDNDANFFSPSANVMTLLGAEVLGALRFRQGHRIVSLIAGFDVAGLRELVAPAGTITRAAPMPAITQSAAITRPPTSVTR